MAITTPTTKEEAQKIMKDWDKNKKKLKKKGIKII
jgi:hypothetical protein